MAKRKDRISTTGGSDLGADNPFAALSGAGLPEDRLARVMDYLYFATDTQRLADQAAYISYGPARASSAGLVGNHATLGIPMAPHMPTDPANMDGAFVTNYLWWADYRDEIDARFQAWLAQ